MSGPPRMTSSRAPQRGEEALMIIHDLGDGRGFRRRVPLVDLERAAKDDPVGPGEHVAGSAGEGILDFRLRLEDRKLASGRVQVLVIEQVAAAEAGAVEDEDLRQCRNVGWSCELADFELAA